MRKTIILFLIIILILLNINSIMPEHLNDFDGQTHFNYITNSGDCEGYPGFMCMTLKPLTQMGEYWFWLFFFIIIAVVIPFLFYYFTKNKDILLGYYFFTGFFFTAETLQVYSQVLLGVFFLWFFLSKNRVHKLGIILFLFFTWSLGFPIHSQQIVIIPFMFLLLFYDEYKKFFYSGVLAIAPIFGWPIQFASDIRTAMTYPGTTMTLIASIIYYSYHFLFKNMLFLFSIPAIYNMFKEKNWYEVLFFIFIFFGALAYWGYEGFTVWRVTRVLIWLPLILLPSFMRWLELQKKNTQRAMWLIGAIWFLIQCYIYFLNKVNIFYD